jgi:hypothetical protein
MLTEIKDHFLIAKPSFSEPWKKRNEFFAPKSSGRLPQIDIIPRNIIRLIANVAVAVGLLLLVRVFYHAANGSLVAQLFPESQQSWISNLYAIALSLAVPIHMISVGFVMQRRWLSPHWTRIVWLAVVISGCWLGVALMTKVFLFH